MGYAIAWALYLVMAVLLVLGWERYLTPLLASRSLRLFLRVLLCILLFTPGLVLNEGETYVAPAAIAVLFNILAKSGLEAMKAALPLLAVAVVAYGLLFVHEIRQEKGGKGSA